MMNLGINCVDKKATKRKFGYFLVGKHSSDMQVLRHQFSIHVPANVIGAKYSPLYSQQDDKWSVMTHLLYQSSIIQNIMIHFYINKWTLCLPILLLQAQFMDHIHLELLVGQFKSCKGCLDFGVFPQRILEFGLSSNDRTKRKYSSSK